MAPSPLACRHPGGLPVLIEGSARCGASTTTGAGRAPPSSSPVLIEGSARCGASTTTGAGRAPPSSSPVFDLVFGLLRLLGGFGAVTVAVALDHSEVDVDGLVLVGRLER